MANSDVAEIVQAAVRHRANTIPQMTDPLGKYWYQPYSGDILVDDHHAVMSKTSFKQLPEYSRTMPTGVYPGKMWKAERAGGIWHLVWYGECDDPKLCSIERRIVLITDDEA